MIRINYANPDMVGHTGDLKATITSVEFVDKCLQDLLDTCDKARAGRVACRHSQLLTAVRYLGRWAVAGYCGSWQRRRHGPAGCEDQEAHLCRRQARAPHLAHPGACPGCRWWTW